MKKITLKSLELKFFKGIKELKVDLNKVTNIYGTNKSGKTTLVNSVIWLFWGKDILDRKDFQIKTLDANNVPLHKVQHEVCGVFDIDGDEFKLQRIYKEKWQTKRGEENDSLVGHETNFFINEVPKSLGDYVNKLKELIGDEMLFKMLTNPLFFNGDNFAWGTRRDILVSVIGGERSDKEIGGEKFKELFDKLSNKSIEEYKREITNKKKKLKESIDDIPVRIDELKRNTPELPKSSIEDINKGIEKLKNEIIEIDKKILDKSKVSEEYFERVNKRVRDIGKLGNFCLEVENKAKLKISENSGDSTISLSELNKKLLQLNQSIDDDGQEITVNNSRIKLTEDFLEKLRGDIGELNKREFVFDEDKAVCPTCERKLDDGDISAKREELLANFNTSKVEDGEKINELGKQKKSEIERLTKKNEELENTIELAKEEIVEVRKEITELKSPKKKQSIESILAENKEYQEALALIGKLERENQEPEPIIDTSDLVEYKGFKQDEIDSLNKELGIFEQIEKSDIREGELLKEQRGLSQQLSLLQKDEFTIEEFTRLKISSVEKPINNLFKTIKFKLFETQLNEGLKECCDCLIDGVPFLAANNAAQINAGIEIINVLNEHFGVSLPIWVDNRESVVELTETDNQLINLYVSKKDLTLRVE